ncbi:MAG TPA: hypothetical protein VFB22_07845 [Candidatus Baltobacteraceae bacterium]|nr:hypothetical protein [Candidatus Baltobacteraceae bacterium]
MTWRTPASLVALAFLAWVGYEIGRAGSDMTPPPIQGATKLINGAMHGKRFDQKAWSLDYDTITFSPDGTQATIAHVRDGRIHRPGKPDVLLKADDVTFNTVTSDLTVGGPIDVVEPLGDGETRTFKSVGARYFGISRTLELTHPSTITGQGATLTVANAQVNFRTGDITLGRVVGTKPGGV